MEQFVQIGTTSDFKPGMLKMVNIEGHEYLLARIKDNYYATDNRCPHMGGNLSHGQLNGTVITCPRHHSQFDLSDGHNIRWTDWTGIMAFFGKLCKRPRPLQMYNLKIEGDKIMLGAPRAK